MILNAKNTSSDCPNRILRWHFYHIQKPREPPPPWHFPNNLLKWRFFFELTLHTHKSSGGNKWIYYVFFVQVIHKACIYMDRGRVEGPFRVLERKSPSRLGLLIVHMRWTVLKRKTKARARLNIWNGVHHPPTDDILITFINQTATAPIQTTTIYILYRLVDTWHTSSRSSLAHSPHRDVAHAHHIHNLTGNTFSSTNCVCGWCVCVWVGNRCGSLKPPTI